MKTCDVFQKSSQVLYMYSQKNLAKNFVLHQKAVSPMYRFRLKCCIHLSRSLYLNSNEFKNTVYIFTFKAKFGNFSIH